MQLGPSLANAVHWVTELHRDQTRKGGTIPYVSHLLGVAALVVEDGGDETDAVAALLHDAVEDQGGLETLAQIRERFGPEVADIVEACSDSVSEPKASWLERKQNYIAEVDRPETSERVLRVSAADKLHNVRSILSDLDQRGEEIWGHFHAPPHKVHWYYATLAEIYERRLPSSRSVTALRRAVDEMASRLPNPDLVET